VTVRIALVLFVCLAASVLESVFPFLLHLRDARADLLLCVVLYLALHDEWVQGAALSLGAGYLADLTSATPAGFYTFLAVLTFVVVRLTGSAFKSEAGPQIAVLAFFASLAHSLVASALFRFVIPGERALLLHVSGAIWSAVATGLGALLVFAVLRRIDAGFLHGEAAPRASSGKGF
jgi:rod shape-determining protein MreD